MIQEWIERRDSIRRNHARTQIWPLPGRAIHNWEDPPPRVFPGGRIGWVPAQLTEPTPCVTDSLVVLGSPRGARGNRRVSQTGMCARRKD